jgi:superfamily I DNA/RNA helicase
MDSIEVSRQRAERLHADAIAAGDDPWNSYAFACAEAKRRDLVVEKVPPGDVRLFGGRALYDPDALLILHEETGDNFTNAFLVAHEVGHVDCEGLAEPFLSIAIDPLRSSETIPLGVDRVVDYSRRERREVQMDLFAREFLMPRSWLRTLHIDEQSSATAIAEKLRAPHRVVAQQLLDALLLPRIDLSAETQAVIRPLKPDQKEATEHEGSPYLLEAGPGTGKTQTLVGRIDHLLGKGVNPEKILILTFSNKAAGELSERIAVRHPEAVASMWVGTFHGFGLDIVRRFHDRLNLPPNPRLVDRTDAIEFLENEYPRLELKHFKDLLEPSRPLGDILNAISRANDEVVDASEYRSLAESMLHAATSDEERLLAEKNLEVATVFAAYERLKAEHGCVDFGDLVAIPVRLCESYPEIGAHLTGLYEHILVDEYQDVNRSSVRLLKGISGDGRNLWAVGDMKQSIYRFRGASSFNMARFDREDFKGGTRGRLKRNYRSSEEIIAAYSTFAGGMASVSGAMSSLECERGPAHVLPEYRSVESADDEIAAVAETIEELRKAGFAYRQQAILSSGNQRLGRFARGLERLGIPVLYLGSLFERDEIKDLLSLLSIAVDRRAMGLLRVAAMPDYAVPLADIARLLEHLKEHELKPLEWSEQLDSVTSLSAAGQAGLRRIAVLLAGSGVDANPWAVLCTVLLDRSRIAAELSQASDARTRSKGIAVWQFMNFLRTQPKGSGLAIVRLLERIRRLILLSDERDLRQLPAAAQGIDAVRLMTMHGSKGLEFGVVHIPGLNNGSFPQSPNAKVARGIAPPDGMIEGTEGKGLDAIKIALGEEQECLFFVALSRARDRLHLYSPTKMKDGKRWQRSPFIDRLGVTLSSSHVSPKLKLPPNEEEARIPLKIEGSFAFSDHQLGLFQRCPRRFLYTHILEVGGRRSETAFMKLHVAVQQVVDGIAGEPGETLSHPHLESLLECAWDEHGPFDHGFSTEYKAIARQLVRFLSEIVAGKEFLPAPQLRLPIPGGEIVITPDHVTRSPQGAVVMRRIDTGHKGSTDEESLSSAAFHLAANSHTPGCTVELVHLSDGAITPIAFTKQKLTNRHNSIGEMGNSIKAGDFPLVESITCPRCPVFFICGCLPPGPLTKKLVP